MAFSPAGPQPLEAYANATSIEAGRSIGFCVAVQSGAIRGLTLDVFRSAQIEFKNRPIGGEADLIYQRDPLPNIAVRAGQIPIRSSRFDASVRAVPPDAAQAGCGWPVSVSWAVPADAPSGVHLARVGRGADVAWTLFVVRPAPAERARRSAILCQLSVNTYQAYNPWGGACFYGPPISDRLVDQVSFDRPCQLWDYFLYDHPIVTWLEANTPVEFCTNVDLDTDASLLDNYHLFVSCGHDEYWSSEMRDRVEAFGSNGGNVLFLGGNTVYRRVESASRGRLMRRVKPDGTSAAQPSWDELGRPEALTTGLRFSGGHWSSPLPPKGYTIVADGSHWTLAGTGLTAGAVIGETAAGGIIGYETDAAVLDGRGVPAAPTPSDFVTIAQAGLPDWKDLDPGGGRATMGLFSRDGRGVVFNAGTTDWGVGLTALGDAAVQKITSNLVAVLRHPVGGLVWFKGEQRTGSDDSTAGRVLDRIGWSAHLFAFSGADGVAYAVDGSGDLRRYPEQTAAGCLDPASVQTIGRGGWQAFAGVFCGGAGVIYALAPDGTLKRYKDPMTGGDVVYERDIGPPGWASGFRLVFSGGGDTIYAVDRGGRLNVFVVPDTGDIALRAVGRDGWDAVSRAFPGGQGVFYAVDRNGDLNRFEDEAGDGAVDGSSGTLIGRGGWTARRLAFCTGGGNIYAVVAPHTAPGEPMADA